MEGIVFQGVGGKILDEIVKQSMFRRVPDNEPALYIWNANSVSQLDALVSEAIGTRLEMLERMAQDTKKVCVYDKHVDTWSWCHRDEADNYEAGHHGFKTRLAALLDAVDPYIDEEE